MSVALSKYYAACRAVAAAKSVDELQKIRNEAEAIRAYAKRAKDRALELDAVEVRIRAERRLGELMTAQKDAVGLNRGAKGSKITGSKRIPVKDDRPTLAEVGIDKNLADRARKLAALSKSDFDTVISQWRTRIANSHDNVTVHVLKEWKERLIRDESEKRENELTKTKDPCAPMECFEYQDADDNDDALPPKYQTLKQRYEQMLRENWSAENLPESYNSAVKIAADVLWRVTTLSGYISTPGANRDFFVSRLYDLGERLDSRVEKLEAAYFASLNSSQSTS